MRGHDFVAPVPVRKDDDPGAPPTPTAPAAGPSQSDVHVDRIIGAIHPFVPLDADSRMCAKCGLTRASHGRSFTKSDDAPNGWDNPADPLPDERDADIVTAEEHQDNLPTTPPSPMLWRFITPTDDASDPVTDPMLQRGNGVLAPSTTPPAGFHEPIATFNKTRTATQVNARPNGADPDFPRGAQSGQDGSWQSSTFNFVPAGQLAGKANTRPAALDLPRDPMGNIIQDGPVFGPSNPGAPPETQVDTPSWGSSDVEVPRNGTVLHHFKQCPQCGVATEPTNKLCPNPWCGHDLSNDQGSSYDHWEETGGVSKAMIPLRLTL